MRPQRALPFNPPGAAAATPLSTLRPRNSLPSSTPATPTSMSYGTILHLLEQRQTLPSSIVQSVLTATAAYVVSLPRVLSVRQPVAVVGDIRGDLDTLLSKIIAPVCGLQSAAETGSKDTTDTSQRQGALFIEYANEPVPMPRPIIVAGDLLGEPRRVSGAAQPAPMNNCEVLLTLFLLSLMHRGRVHILRSATDVKGSLPLLKAECETKFDVAVFEAFAQILEALPFAATVPLYTGINAPGPQLQAHNQTQAHGLAFSRNHETVGGGSATVLLVSGTADPTTEGLGPLIGDVETEGSVTVGVVCVGGQAVQRGCEVVPPLVMGRSVHGGERKVPLVLLSSHPHTAGILGNQGAFVIIDQSVRHIQGSGMGTQFLPRHQSALASGAPHAYPSLPSGTEALDVQVFVENTRMVLSLYVGAFEAASWSSAGAPPSLGSGGSSAAASSAWGKRAHVALQHARHRCPFLPATVHAAVKEAASMWGLKSLGEGSTETGVLTNERYRALRGVVASMEATTVRTLANAPHQRRRVTISSAHQLPTQNSLLVKHLEDAMLLARAQEFTTMFDVTEAKALSSLFEALSTEIPTSPTNEQQPQGMMELVLTPGSLRDACMYTLSPRLRASIEAVEKEVMRDVRSAMNILDHTGYGVVNAHDFLAFAARMKSLHSTVTPSSAVTLGAPSNADAEADTDAEPRTPQVRRYSQASKGAQIPSASYLTSPQDNAGTVTTASSSELSASIRGGSTFQTIWNPEIGAPGTTTAASTSSSFRNHLTTARAHWPFRSEAVDLAKEHLPPFTELVGTVPWVADDVPGADAAPFVELQRHITRMEAVHQRMAQGAYGPVFKAQFRSQDVAVKVQPWSTDTALQAGVLMELSMLSTLSHPHIVRLVGCFHDLRPRPGRHAGGGSGGDGSSGGAYHMDGAVYTVTQLCEYGALRDTAEVYLRGHPAEWAVKTRVVQDVASALSYLHAKSIAHRNVKSVNVFVDSGFRGHLGGFHGAYHSRSSSTPAPISGTVEYMAPEVALGAASTPAADIFSLGVVVCELCCGSPPSVDFIHRTEASHYAVDMAEVRGKALQGIPSELLDIAAHCCASDPHLRPSAGKLHEMLGALSGNLHSTPVQNSAAVPHQAPATRPSTCLPREGRHMSWATPSSGTKDIQSVEQEQDLHSRLSTMMREISALKGTNHKLQVELSEERAAKADATLRHDALVQSMQERDRSGSELAQRLKVLERMYISTRSELKEAKERVEKLSAENTMKSVPLMTPFISGRSNDSIALTSPRERSDLDAFKRRANQTGSPRSTGEGQGGEMSVSVLWDAHSDLNQRINELIEQCASGRAGPLDEGLVRNTVLSRLREVSGDYKTSIVESLRKCEDHVSTALKRLEEDDVHILSSPSPPHRGQGNVGGQESMESSPRHGTDVATIESEAAVRMQSGVAVPGESLRDWVNRVGGGGVSPTALP